MNQEILVQIRRGGNISHLFIAFATQRSMGEDWLAHCQRVLDMHILYMYKPTNTTQFVTGHSSECMR